MNLLIQTTAGPLGVHLVAGRVAKAGTAQALKRLYGLSHAALLAYCAAHGWTVTASHKPSDEGEGETP